MIVTALQKRRIRFDLLVNDDKEKIVIVPVPQKRQDRLDLLLFDNDKDKTVIVSVLQKRKIDLICLLLMMTKK